jgi:hypothetical protein
MLSDQIKNLIEWRTLTITAVDEHPYIAIVGVDLGAGSGSQSLDGEGVVLSLDSGDRLDADQ